MLKSKAILNEVTNTYQQKLVNIHGTLTSSLQLRQENSSDAYYYAFIRLKEQTIDLPVIFKVKCPGGNLVNPKLKKGDIVQLNGNYSHSEKNIRKSFTCSFYEILN